MSAIFQYSSDNDSPVYLSFSDEGKLLDIRAEDDDITEAEVIANLVHLLTAAELSAKVIKNQCKEISDALAIINDERTRIEHRL